MGRSAEAWQEEEPEVVTELLHEGAAAAEGALA